MPYVYSIHVYMHIYEAFSLRQNEWNEVRYLASIFIVGSCDWLIHGQNAKWVMWILKVFPEFHAFASNFIFELTQLPFTLWESGSFSWDQIFVGSDFRGIRFSWDQIFVGSDFRRIRFLRKNCWVPIYSNFLSKYNRKKKGHLALIFLRKFIYFYPLCHLSFVLKCCKIK